MARREMRERIAQRVNSVRFEDLARLLEAYGFELDRVRGSHHIYRRGGSRFTLPHRRPTVLPVYVRQVLAMTEGEDDGEND